MSMGDEGFLRRWSRRKTESKLEPDPASAAAPSAPAVALEPRPAPAGHAVPVPPPPPGQGGPAVALPADTALADGAATAEAQVGLDQPRLPTMDDVAQLTPDSDFSAFVARGVDGAVRRSALKKLFADPHFNVLDRLDMYMDDYNKPSPMPEGMLDALKHANSFFQRVAGENGQGAADLLPAASEAVQQRDSGTDAGTGAGTGSTDIQASTITTPETETR